MLEDIFTLSFFLTLLVSTFRIMTPVLYCTLGEILGERSGVINVGLEGIMLSAAFASFWTTYSTGNYLAGLIIGMLVGCVCGALASLFSIHYAQNQVLTGFGMFFLGWGAASFAYTVFSPSQTPTISPLQLTFLDLNVMTYAALLLTPLIGIFLFRTRKGLNLRATGESAKVADIMGVNVFRVRSICMVVSSALAGIGASYITLVQAGAYQDAITAGRGWLALGLAGFARWNPYRAFWVCLFFGLVDAFQMRLQASGATVPYQFLQMLPYILALVFLALAGKEAIAPADLGKPYKRE